MGSVSVRLRNKASGAVSTPSAVSWTESGGGLPNPDYGRDLKTWALKAGGQTLVLPDGTYTASSISAGAAGSVHSDWLILKAQNKGGVVVDGLTWTGVTKVMLVGMNFTGRVQILGNSDRIIPWYCSVAAPVVAGDTRNGFQVFGGTNLRFLGCDVRNCTQDGFHFSAPGITARVEGTRIWGITAPPEYNEHNDSIQMRSGSVVVKQSVCGLNATGGNEGNGHIQVQSDGGPASLSFDDCWVANSGNNGFTTDNKGTSNPCVINVTNVRTWGHQFSNVSGNGTFNEITPLLGQPAVGATPPDVAWRTANPYNSHAAWLAASGL